MIETLIVIAKRPEPGRSKTRLSPPLSAQQAAVVAAGALSDTLCIGARTPARKHLLAFEGSPIGWLPPGWQHTPQPEGGLDRRIAAAFAAASDGAALLIGMDTPQVRRDQLCAFDASTYDACLGMARDGGYWAIGLRDPRIAHAVVVGIPMSTPHTGSAQLERMKSLGLKVQLLDELDDVDTIDVAYAVADLIPFSAFAQALAQAGAAQAEAVG